MTEEQYKTELAKILFDYEQRKKDLRIKYATQNNPYKIDDVFTDHIGSIVINKIQVTLNSSSDLPSCVYSGIELNKDGRPNKKQKNRYAYLQNDIKNYKP